MIPTMILVGLVLGLAYEPLHHRGRGIAITAVGTALAFGLVVGDVLGGILLALVNIVVGGLGGFLIQEVGRSALGIPSRTKRRRPRHPGSATPAWRFRLGE